MKAHTTTDIAIKKPVLITSVLIVTVVTAVCIALRIPRIILWYTYFIPSLVLVTARYSTEMRDRASFLGNSLPLVGIVGILLYFPCMNLYLAFHDLLRPNSLGMDYPALRWAYHLLVCVILVLVLIPVCLRCRNAWSAYAIWGVLNISAVFLYELLPQSAFSLKVFCGAACAVIALLCVLLARSRVRRR